MSKETIVRNEGYIKVKELRKIKPQWRDVAEELYDQINCTIDDLNLSERVASLMKEFFDDRRVRLNVAELASDLYVAAPNELLKLFGACIVASQIRRYEREKADQKKMKNLKKEGGLQEHPDTLHKTIEYLLDQTHEANNSERNPSSDRLLTVFFYYGAIAHNNITRLAKQTGGREQDRLEQQILTDIAEHINNHYKIDQSEIEKVTSGDS